MHPRGAVEDHLRCLGTVAVTRHHHGAAARHLDHHPILVVDHVSHKTNAVTQVAATSHQVIETAQTAVAASIFQFLAVRYILWLACCMQVIVAANKKHDILI